jgi:UDPglucose 6-dehydrogenase
VRVAVMGQGYVGLTAATCLAIEGHQVVGVEQDAHRLATLAASRVPVYEPGLAELFGRAVNECGLIFRRSLLDVEGRLDAVVIAVGSPPGPGGAADLRQVENALAQAASISPAPELIVTKTSIPPGTSASWRARPGLASLMRDRYVHNPEFLNQGTAIRDWREPARVVAGLWNQELVPAVRELFAGCVSPWVVASPTSAEMIKYMSNAYLATRISFANEVARACEGVGAQVDDVIEGMSHDPRIGHMFWRPGVGYGDSCLPKDVDALLRCAGAHGFTMPLVEATRRVNKEQRGELVRRVCELVAGVGRPRVAVLGLAYEPHSDDLRAAPSREVIPELLSAGLEVRVWDPMIERSTAQAQGVVDNQVHWQDSFAEAVRGAHATVVLTEYPEVVNTDWTALVPLLEPPRAVVDAKNCLVPEKIAVAGGHYRGFGRVSTAAESVRRGDSPAVPTPGRRSARATRSRP